MPIFLFIQSFYSLAYHHKLYSFCIQSQCHFLVTQNLIALKLSSSCSYPQLCPPSNLSSSLTNPPSYCQKLVLLHSLWLFIPISINLFMFLIVWLLKTKDIATTLTRASSLIHFIIHTPDIKLPRQTYSNHCSSKSFHYSQCQST